MHTETCCNCGIEFGIPDGIFERRQTDGGSFWCPNGHQQHYIDSRIAQLEQRAAELEKKYQEQTITLDWYVDVYVPNLARKIEKLRAERKSARCSVAAYRGHLARARQKTV